MHKTPLIKIERIDLDPYLLSYVLRITVQKGVLEYTSFVGNHAVEAYTLLRYLWNNPTSYVSMRVIEEEEERKQAERIRQIEEEEKKRSIFFGVC